MYETLKTTVTSNSKKLKQRIRRIVIKPKTLSFSLIPMLLVLTFVYTGTFTEPKEIKAPDTTKSYADLKKISKYKTPYIGAASNVGNITDLLPNPSPFYVKNTFELKTTAKPYELLVHYELTDYEGNQEPFLQSRMENNALILFSFINNVDSISFAVHNSEINYDVNFGVIPTSPAQIHKYIRKDFIEQFGDLMKLAADLDGFNRTLLDNLKIDDEKMHFNRISFGDSREKIIYRNGEPTEIITNKDGNLMMIYKNLGEITQTTPDHIVKKFDGVNVTFYLNRPYYSYNEYKSKEDERGPGLPADESDSIILLAGSLGSEFGVYAISIEGNNVSSEILYNIGVDKAINEVIKKEDIIEAIGEPNFFERKADGPDYLSYDLYSGNNRHVFFIFDQDGILIHHGITIDTKKYQMKMKELIGQ